MIDPSSYRAEPDAEFADRLERVLLERLTAPVGSRSHPPTDTDLDDQPGDIIWLEPEHGAMSHDRVTPRRHPPGRWLLVAAVAAVVAVVGTLLVAAGDADPEDQVPATSTPTTAPTTSTSTTAPDSAQDMMDLEDRGVIVPLAPGRYFLDPDGDDATPLRVTYQIAPADWEAWFGAVKLLVADASQSTGLSIATVTNLATDGCWDPTPLDPPVGPTVDDLAVALSQFAPFEVTAPPTDVTLFGYEGKHLELAGPTGPGDCLDADPYNRTSPISGGSFSGDDGPGLALELWILDVEGTRLVLGKFDNPQSSAQDLAERDAVFDTIRIDP
jgi:hypothetical protein